MTRKREFNRNHMKKCFRKMPRIVLSLIVVLTIPLIPVLVLMNNIDEIGEALNESLDIIIGKDITK